MKGGAPSGRWKREAFMALPLSSAAGRKANEETMSMPESTRTADEVAHPSRALFAALVVSALGYFVDIYDLILFSIVRIKSLRAIGVPDAQLLDEGIRLINWQMSGMLLGGIV